MPTTYRFGDWLIGIYWNVLMLFLLGGIIVVLCVFKLPNDASNIVSLYLGGLIATSKDMIEVKKAPQSATEE